MRIVIFPYEGNGRHHRNGTQRRRLLETRREVTAVVMSLAELGKALSRRAKHEAERVTVLSSGVNVAPQVVRVEQRSVKYRPLTRDDLEVIGTAAATVAVIAGGVAYYLSGNDVASVLLAVGSFFGVSLFVFDVQCQVDNDTPSTRQHAPMVQDDKLISVSAISEPMIGKIQFQDGNRINYIHWPMSRKDTKELKELLILQDWRFNRPNWQLAGGKQNDYHDVNTQLIGADMVIDNYFTERGKMFLDYLIGE